MSKSRTITASIKLDDTKFKNSVKNINASLKLVNQQFKEGQSAIKTYGATQENLAKVQEAYNKKLEILKKQQEGYKKLIENEQKALKANTEERDKLNKKLEEQKKKVEEAKKSHGENSKEVEKEEKALEKMTKELIKAENAITKNNTNITNYNTVLSKSQTEINKTEGQLKELSKEFDNVGTSSQQLNETVKAFNINNVIDGVKNFTSGLANTFDKINGKIIGFGRDMLNVGVGFEQSMATFHAVSGATAEDLQRVEDKAKELGKNTKYSASQASDAFGYMALAGFTVEDSLYSVEKVLKLATVGQMDLALASDMYTDTLSALGLELKDTEHYMDILAQTQSKSNTTAKMMMEAYLGAGGQFNKFNTPLEESATMIGLLANNGMKGSEAGNSLNSVLINLNGSVEKVAKAYKKMGIEAYDSKGQFVGYESVLRQLSKKMGTMTEEQKTMWETVLGGKTQAQSLFILLEGMGSGAYDTLKASITDCNGALDKQNDILNSTPEAKIAGLKSQFEALQLKVFDAFAPTMEKAMNSISKFLDKLNNMDEGTLDTIINLAKWSLIMGVVTKGISGLAGGVGNIVGLMANFKALTIGTSTASLAMAGATSTATTAVAGAGASMASTGGLVAGLGGALAKVGTFLMGPWGLAIGAGVLAIGGLAYAVKKGSEDCVKEVDIWADGTVKGTKKVTDAYGNVVEVANNTQVQISENTKNNLQGILNQHDEHSKKLTEFAMRERELTDAEYKELKILQKQLTFDMSEEDRRSKEERLAILQEKFNKEKEITANEYAILKEQMDIMTQETNTKLDEKYANEKQKLITYLMEVQGLTAEQAQQQIAFMDENHTIQSERMASYQEQYYALLEKSYADENGLTVAEHAELMRLEDLLRNYQIESLSETELEAQLIQNRMKDHSLRVSSEQVGGLIKDAENLRVKRIEEANAEFDEYERILTQQKNISGMLTDEQYNNMLEKARETRDEKILTANQEKIGILEEIEAMNKEAYDSVDKNTGEILSKWSTFWQGLTKNTGENAKKNIDEFEKLKKSINDIPNNQTKTVNIVTNYKETGTPIKPKANNSSKTTYRMINHEIATLNLNDNTNFDKLERTINTLTNKVNKAVNSIPDTFNNLIKNIDLVNQNNIFIDKKQIIEDVNRGIEEERTAMEIAKGKQKIIVR